MALSIRSFRRIQTAAKADKGTIKRYNRSHLEESFKKTFLAHVTQLEEDIATAKQTNIDLAAALIKDRVVLDERAVQLDDRTIGLMSFSSVVSFYVRYLEMRQAAASFKLIDPLDDLENYERLVKCLEDSCDSLQSAVELTDLEEYQASVLAEDEEATSLQEQVDLRRANLRYRQVWVKNWAKGVSKEPLLKLRPTVRLEIGSSPMAQFTELPKRIQSATFSKPSPGLAEYQDKETAVRLSEDRAVEFMTKLTSRWRDTERHLQYLSSELHSAAELRLQIDEWSRKLGELRISVMKTGEAEAANRKKIAYLRNFRKNVAEKQRENEEHMKRVTDYQVLQRKKTRQMKHRREKMAQTEQWMVITEKEKAQKDADVGKMERAVVELEIQLNEKLLEGQAISRRLKQLEEVDGKTATAVRIEEMAKVMELVAIDRTEAV
jgi:hypothetical protein